MLMLKLLLLNLLEYERVFDRPIATLLFYGLHMVQTLLKGWIGKVAASSGSRVHIFVRRFEVFGWEILGQILLDFPRQLQRLVYGGRSKQRPYPLLIGRIFCLITRVYWRQLLFGGVISTNRRILLFLIVVTNVVLLTFWAQICFDVQISGRLFHEFVYRSASVVCSSALRRICHSICHLFTTDKRSSTSTSKSQPLIRTLITFHHLQSWPLFFASNIKWTIISSLLRKWKKLLAVYVWQLGHALNANLVPIFLDMLHGWRYVSIWLSMGQRLKARGLWMSINSIMMMTIVLQMTRMLLLILILLVNNALKILILHRIWLTWVQNELFLRGQSGRVIVDH